MAPRSMTTDPSVASPQSDTFRRAVLLSYAMRHLRRALRPIALLALVGVLAASTYAFTRTSFFTASAQVLILGQQADDPTYDYGVPLYSLSEAQVASQISLVQSKLIIEKVVRKLSLEVYSEAELTPSFSDRIWYWLIELIFPIENAHAQSPSQNVPNFDETRLANAIAQVQWYMEVEQIEQSQALKISYTSPDPALATKIANTIAETYVTDWLEKQRLAARTSSSWLKEQLLEMERAMKAAQHEVQLLRARRDYRIVIPPAEVASGNLRSDTSNALRLDEGLSRAETLRSTYETLLGAYTRSLHREKFPLTNVRLITPAIEPKSPSHPRRFLIAAAGAGAGMLAGILLYVFRLVASTTVVSTQQIQSQIGLPCLGLLVKRKISQHWKYSQSNSHRESQAIQANLAAVKYAPASRFVKGIKAIRSMLDAGGRQQDDRIIGVSSALSGEGKTTFASNYALLLASSGLSTLLVDGDYLTATLSRECAPGSALGLSDVLRGTADVDQCIVSLEENLKLLPSGAMPPEGSLAFKQIELRTFASELKNRYDAVVVDLPASALENETIGLVDLTDTVLLIIEWDRTPYSLVMDAIRQLGNAGATIAGVILNKALYPELDYRGGTA